MQREEMDRLIEEHIRAEKASDTAGCVTMYSDDVVHDVVGSPTGPVQVLSVTLIRHRLVL
jgi:hypothetical protein